jgi:formate dehydrogenase major subunit
VPARVVPPDELPDDEYPMVLSTGRVLEHWHTGSMTRRSQVLDQIEPEAVAFMSPKDMRRMKVWPGDLVRLETRRGAVEVKVRSDRDVPENMVFMPFCYAEAAANLLTNPALDPFGKIPEFKFCAVKAERVEIAAAAE